MKKLLNPAFQFRFNLHPCSEFQLPAVKNRLPVAYFPVLPPGGTFLLCFFAVLPGVRLSLRVEIIFLSGREAKFSSRMVKFLAGRLTIQQDAKIYGRTGGFSAGRVKTREKKIRPAFYSRSFK